jgi:hypothetical protein
MVAEVVLDMSTVIRTVLPFVQRKLKKNAYRYRYKRGVGRLRPSHLSRLTLMPSGARGLERKERGGGAMTIRVTVDVTVAA